jgi:hypothetical protein
VLACCRLCVNVATTTDTATPLAWAYVSGESRVRVVDTIVVTLRHSAVVGVVVLFTSIWMIEPTL